VGSAIIKRSKAVICVSQSVAEYVKKSYKERSLEGIIKPIYYGIDPRPFENAFEESKKSKVSKNCFVIGTAARLVPQKSLHTLLQAFALFTQQARTEVKLRIAGDGPLHSQLRNLAKDLEISHLVEWCGQIEDIPGFMASLDLFALTSIYEGLGLVILEAMATRLPVVTSNVSAMSEIAVNNKTGILITPGDAKGFSKAFYKLYSDSELRHRFGSAGHTRLIRHFSIPKMTDETMGAYQ